MTTKSKIRYLLAIFLIFLVSYSHLSISQNLFQRTYGFDNDDEMISRALQISTGGYLIATCTFSVGAGDRDIMILRLDEDGNVLWHKIFGSPARNVVHQLLEANPNKFIIMAWAGQYGTTDDWHLITIDGEGTFLDEFFIGGSYDDEILGMIPISSGGYMVVGSSWSFEQAGHNDLVISRWDDDLNVIWFKTYGIYEQEVLYHLVETSDGNFVGAGFNRPDGLQNDDMIALKFDIDGNLIWNTEIAGNAIDRIFDVKNTTNDEILIQGFTNSFGAGDFDIVVAKLDADGNYLWSKAYGGSGEEKAWNMFDAGNNEFFITGHTTSFGSGAGDILFLKIDEDGNILKSITYGGEEDDLMGYAETTSDGGLIIAGHTESYTSGGFDLFLIKTDAQGVSCCYEEIDNVTVTNGNVVLGSNNYSIGNSFSYTNHNMQFSQEELFELNVCLDSIDIEGPDTVCQNAQNIEYLINPPIVNFSNIEIPVGASMEILEGDSLISIDFGAISGYIVISAGLCNEIYDSLFVTVGVSNDITLGNDTSFCSNDSLLLNPSGSYANYLWQDGSTDSVYWVSGSGLYWVEIIDEFGCTFSDSIIVDLYPEPAIWLGNDTLICGGDSLVLTIDEGYSSYLWSNGSNGNSITVYTPGPYWVSVCNEFDCCTNDTILVAFYPVAFDELELGPDTTFCEGNLLELNAGSGYTFYQWMDGSGTATDSVYVVDTTGLYYVYVSNPCSESWDSIYVEMLEVEDIDLGNDSTICSGEIVYLDASGNFLSYLWQDGSATPFYYASETGLYWVEALDTNNCMARDTVLFEFHSPEIVLGNDTSFCEGESFLIEAPDYFDNYLWNDGSEQSWVQADTSGIFWCLVTDSLGCQGSDSINIEMDLHPVVAIIGNDEVCIGDTTWLSFIGSHIDSCIWSNGTSDSLLMVTETGNYSISVTNNCGTATDSTDVVFVPPIQVFLGNDTILSNGESLVLDAGKDFAYYLWSDGSELQYLEINQPGNYWVNVFDGVCYNTDSIKIEPVACDLFLPIAFSPNGDGSNDFYYADVSEDIIDFSLKVCSRWGEIVWETDNKYEKWDGKRNNLPVAGGTYYYLLNYTCGYNSLSFEKNGHVLIVR